MKPTLYLLALIMLLSTMLTGCLIRTRGNARGGGGRACPPAHHWDGYSCVHNGNGRGNGRGRGNGPDVRDHRH